MAEISKDKVIRISLQKTDIGDDGSYKQELIIDLTCVNNYEALGMLKIAMQDIEYIINGEKN